MTAPKDLGVKVKALRLGRGWSQEDLAAASGVSSRTIQRIETGQAPGLETLRSLAAALETSVADLRVPQAADGFSEAAEHRQWLRFHAILFAMVMLALTLFDAALDDGGWWVQWVLPFWFLGVSIHWLYVRMFFRED